MAIKTYGLERGVVLIATGGRHKQRHDSGVRTIAQDEASCMVFGVPEEAVKLGAVCPLILLGRVADALPQFDAPGRSSLQSDTLATPIRSQRCRQRTRT